MLPNSTVGCSDAPKFPFVEEEEHGRLVMRVHRHRVALDPQGVLADCDQVLASEAFAQRFGKKTDVASCEVWAKFASHAEAFEVCKSADGAWSLRIQKYGTEPGREVTGVVEATASQLLLIEQVREREYKKAHPELFDYDDADGDADAYLEQSMVANRLEQWLCARARSLAVPETYVTMFTVDCNFANARHAAASSDLGIGEFIPAAPHITREPALLYVVRPGTLGWGECLTAP